MWIRMDVDKAKMVYKMQCVHLNKKGHTVFPKKIPKARTGLAHHYMALFSVILLIASFYMLFDGKFEKLWIQVTFLAITPLILALNELVKRFCFFMEELRAHSYPRYNNDYKELLRALKPETRSIFVVIICAVTFILFSPLNLLDILPYLLIILSVLLVKHHFKFGECELYNSMRINQTKGLDYGTGMAHSFVQGYLNMVVPADGFSSYNIEHLMEQYSNAQGIVFEKAKLYILVPLSMECPNQITGPNIKLAKSLDPIERDVAGVIGRSYKNSVYKIEIKGKPKPVYVCAEYATPIRTLQKAMRANNETARRFKMHYKDIIWNFYATTMKLINDDRDLKGRCELIYFDDKLLNGDPINVADILGHKVLKDG